MTQLNRNTPILAALMVSGLSGCEAIDKLKDALEGGPQTSYCEAVCDWAVTCADEDGTSSLTADEMMMECLDATRASDAACEDAENGDLSVDQSLILSECTDAVADMDCKGLTGSATEVTSGRPPELMCIAGYGGVDDVSGLDLSDPASLADVGAYQTYNDARNAVMKTGDEICDDVANSICDALVGCVANTADMEGSDEADALMEECTGVFGGFITSCKDKGLYDQTLPVDVNLTRWAADDCVAGFAEADACDVTAWPLECAGAFVSIDGSDDLTDLVLSSASSFIGGE